HGKAEDAGADGGKGDRGEALPGGQLKGAGVGGPQRRRFALFTAAPDGPDGVDDRPRREGTGAGKSRPVMRSRAVLRHPLVARLLDGWAAAPPYGAGHAAAELQMRVGGVDDGLGVALR